MWTLELTRMYSTSFTKGRLRVLDGQGVERFACWVLELPWLGNQRNISCIPEGSYSTVHYTRPSGRGEAILVENVPGRSGILFHAGNVPSDTRGCLLVGDAWSGGSVLNSVATLARLLAVLPRGVRHRLVIREASLAPDFVFPLAVAVAAAFAYRILSR
ncbi:MAG: DUF5675 family protein [Bacteroidetes bacterium]|nr:DUF5675 family protein [Bacteroidota bacterium]